MTKHIKILILEDQLSDTELIKKDLIKSNLDFKLLVVGTKSKYEQEEEEQHQSDEKMRLLNNRLVLAAKSAGIGVWEWDLIKGSLEWDTSMYEFYQMKPDQSVPILDSWLGLLHPDDLEKIKNLINKGIFISDKHESEFRIISKEGHIRHIHASAIIERDAQKRPIRMIGVNTDVTARVLADRERELIIEDMVKRNAALEQFTYIISHNLRSPIANIIGAANILSDNELGANDRQVLTKAIHESVVKLDNITRDLNDILSVKGDIYNHNEHVYFADLVEDIRISIVAPVNSDDFSLTYNFSALSRFFTLKLYIQSIFYNLITNSIKYRQKNIPCIITINSKIVDNTFELSFTDNGTGFNMEKHGPHIFGLYKRFHEDIEGKGMGLFMVKTQVEKLGGKIEVSSVELEGTTFKITFDL